MKAKKETKTIRLKRLENKLAFLQKSKKYVDSELDRIRKREKDLSKKISKEKKAISLVNKAKKLR